jgi:5-methylcytosine-specific restriction endonuclease McrA
MRRTLCSAWISTKDFSYTERERGCRIKDKLAWRRTEDIYICYIEGKQKGLRMKTKRVEKRKRETYIVTFVKIDLPAAGTKHTS